MKLHINQKNRRKIIGFALGIIVVVVGIGVFYLVQVMPGKETSAERAPQRRLASEPGFTYEMISYLYDEHGRVQEKLDRFSRNANARYLAFNYGLTEERQRGVHQIHLSFQVLGQLIQQIDYGLKWLLGHVVEIEEDLAKSTLDMITGEGIKIYHTGLLKWDANQIELLLVQYFFDNPMHDDDQGMKDEFFVLMNGQRYFHDHFNRYITLMGYLHLTFDVQDVIGVSGLIPAALTGYFNGGSNLTDRGEMEASSLFAPGNLPRPLTNLGRGGTGLKMRVFDRGNTMVAQVREWNSYELFEPQGDTFATYFAFSSVILQNNFGQPVNEDCTFRATVSDGGQVGEHFVRPGFTGDTYSPMVWLNQRVCVNEKYKKRIGDMLANGLRSIADNPEDEAFLSKVVVDAVTKNGRIPNPFVNVFDTMVRSASPLSDMRVPESRMPLSRLTDDELREIGVPR